MLMSFKYNRAKALAKIEHGRKMARARWLKRDEDLVANPPEVSDANRVFDYLQARRGKIAYTNDWADHFAREVVTWVLRYSVKGRVTQFDLYRNGEFVMTGGMKRCAVAMTPKIFPILRYD